MTGSPELLEFYLVEATEYLDALDQLVATTAGAPDGNAFIATARALRGASTMAKADTIAALAALIEQLAHGVRDGDTRWTFALQQSLRQTVSDLRFLVRGVRTWGDRESARAETRLAELRRFLPAPAARPTPASATATAPVFIALQSSAIAAELDAFVSNPRHRRALDDALTRARTMRGIAGIADFPPLADVADAVDRTGRALMPDAPLSEAEEELFRSAADVLRETSGCLRESTAIALESATINRFGRAVDALDRLLSTAESDGGAGHVVSIDQLFYADSGPHIVQRSAAPPTTQLDRFREEITTRAEHLRRLVGDARQVHDSMGRARAGRALRAALVEMQGVAASFGAHQVARFFGEAALEHDVGSPVMLDAIEAGALMLLTPVETLDEIEGRLAVLERTRRATPIVSPAVESAPRAEPTESRALSAPVVPATITPATITPLMVTPLMVTPTTVTPLMVTPTTVTPLTVTPTTVTPTTVTPTTVTPTTVTPLTVAPLTVTPAPGPLVAPAAAPLSAAPPSRGLSTQASPRPHPPLPPTGRELQQLLQEGIASFLQLEDEPLSEPTRLDEEDIVPIESLLYRGQTAVRRAIDVRDQMRARGAPDDATLQEIYDLLDLAQAE